MFHNGLAVVGGLACLIHLLTSSPILALAATSSSGSPGSFAYMSTQCDVPKYFVLKHLHVKPCLQFMQHFNGNT